MHRSLILGLAAVLPLAACATPEPAKLSTEFVRPEPARWAKPAAAGPACKVKLGQIRDLRSDPTALGYIAGREVQAEDTPAWVGSGLQSLAQDARITLVGETEPPDVVVEADLLKAYILSQTQTKAANVVLRVRYRQGEAAPAEQTYRGATNGLNWASGQGEANAALNKALGEAVDAIHADLIGMCGSARPTAAK